MASRASPFAPPVTAVCQMGEEKNVQSCRQPCTVMPFSGMKVGERSLQTIPIVIQRLISCLDRHCTPLPPPPPHSKPPSPNLYSPPSLPPASTAHVNRKPAVFRDRTRLLRHRLSPEARTGCLQWRCPRRAAMFGSRVGGGGDFFNFRCPVWPVGSCYCAWCPGEW